jgi:hypothetical protein
VHLICAILQGETKTCVFELKSAVTLGVAIFVGCVKAVFAARAGMPSFSALAISIPDSFCISAIDWPDWPLGWKP